jgi:hypothetical protein
MVLSILMNLSAEEGCDEAKFPLNTDGVNEGGY